MITVREHFNQIAGDYDGWKKKNWYYYKSLKDLYHNLIPEGTSVLEAGCGTGEILVFLKPSRGVGFDISEKMIALGKEKYKDYKGGLRVTGNLFFEGFFVPRKRSSRH